jgi:hypothetical protein
LIQIKANGGGGFSVSRAKTGDLPCRPKPPSLLPGSFCVRGVRRGAGVGQLLYPQFPRTRRGVLIRGHGAMLKERMEGVA